MKVTFLGSEGSVILPSLKAWDPFAGFRPVLQQSSLS